MRFLYCGDCRHIMCRYAPFLPGYPYIQETRGHMHVHRWYTSKPPCTSCSTINSEGSLAHTNSCRNTYKKGKICKQVQSDVIISGCLPFALWAELNNKQSVQSAQQLHDLSCSSAGLCLSESRKDVPRWDADKPSSSQAWVLLQVLSKPILWAKVAPWMKRETPHGECNNQARESG